MCKRVNLFKTKCEAKVRIPLEFKILMALRIIGRGNVSDDIAEMSGGCESSVQAVFVAFVEGFVEHFFADFVKVPTGDHLRKTMAIYEQLGLVGCLGSMDCTHIHLNKCPTWLTAMCTGKEGFPTLSFNCVVDHLR